MVEITTAAREQERSICDRWFKMRQVRYRALIALDPVDATQDRVSMLSVPQARTAPDDDIQVVRSQTRLASIPRQYSNHTHALMVRASCLDKPSYARCFPAEISWDDEEPLHPGDRAEVTITMIDDEACAFFGAGQRFSLWNGADVGHGTISRQVHTEYGPC
jgi:hypothetical protein